MKLFILALFSLILAVNSESKALKANDQKSQDSAFLQKFLPPLNHDVNQRYGVNRALSGEELIKSILSNSDHKYYDYIDDHDEHHLVRDGNLRALYNQPNIWGYSRDGGLGNLVSHSYNGDPNVWGYLRNAEGRLRNEVAQVTPRPEARLRNLGHVPLRPAHRVHSGTMGPEIMGYPKVGLGNMGHSYTRHRNPGHGNRRLGHMIYNLNALLEPDHIGYVGQVDPHVQGLKERYNFALVTGRELELHRRAGMYGLSTPLPLLRLVGRKPHLHHGQ